MKFSTQKTYSCGLTGPAWAQYGQQSSRETPVANQHRDGRG